jgi:aspartyl-tRNA(Asn)/glutamyl-tRNA(Gln) amidotransferase subunit B
MNTSYEMVIGLEVHVELKTATKIFCGCSTRFGAAPNTQCCPVCTGMPGSLPVLNGQVVEYAVMAGLATGCKIAEYSKQDRKNYFYPDLPKAYQISQYDLPLCTGGHLDIETAAGHTTVGITRIHIEEDAGKLIHVEGRGTRIDCNRCGVPLIEIVSEPDIRSAEEAKAYLQKLRAIMRYIGVSDCKMNEGSLRCDVNLSIRKAGSDVLGTRTEMKNLNSFQNVEKAIEYEFARQVSVLEEGGQVIQETRRFDAAERKTFSMRAKENADDYRYFPDPDLVPVVVSAELRETLKNALPMLPDQRKQEFVSRYGLSTLAAEELVTRKDLADFFSAAAAECSAPVILANLVSGELARLCPEDQDIPVSPDHVAALAQMLADGTINGGTCKKVLNQLVAEDQDPAQLIETQGLRQISDPATLLPLAQAVLAEQPKTLADYRSGNKNAFHALVGSMMKKTQGKGNPQVIHQVLAQLLEQD